MEDLKNFTTIERMLIQQSGLKKRPINGSIELLPLCNMNCDMCYVRLSRSEMEAQGRLRTADEWISIASQMQKAGVLFLLLTGGEPFLYPEFRSLYQRLLKLGMILTINTNGTLITEELAQFLAKNKPRRINITLYGADDEAYRTLCHYPGGFTKTVQGIHLLKKYGIDVKVSCSVTPDNRSDIQRLLQIGNELGVPVRMDTYMLPAIRERSLPFNRQSRLMPEEAARARIEALKGEMGPELFRDFTVQTLEQIADSPASEEVPLPMSCLAGSCSFTINWKGEIQPCVILDQPSISVFEHGFEPAWQQIVQACSHVRLYSGCSVCRLRPLCRTCAACALYETGAFDQKPEYMCRYASESYRMLQEEAASD